MTVPAEHFLDGKYEILGKIGEGGMGAIYKARHRLLDEVRVIKTLRAEHSGRESLQQRFKHEARIAIRLKHPGIAQLHDFSIAEDGTAYIIMEFIDGVGIDRVLKGCGRLSAGAAAAVAEQTLDALEYLHAQGIVHRDIAPDNLMLCRGFDGKPRVKIIDLGIAKNLSETSGLTQTGTFLGKIRYCSPEHFSESRDVDHRGDIYSFGLVLYEMVTGTHPIPGESFPEMAAGHLFQPPLAFSETDPSDQVPGGLRAVILEALAKKPEERFSSAGEFASSLRSLALGGGEVDQELAEVLETALASRPEVEVVGTTDQERLDDEFKFGDDSGSSRLESKLPATFSEGGELSSTKESRVGSAEAAGRGKAAVSGEKAVEAETSKAAKRLPAWLWAAGAALFLVVGAIGMFGLDGLVDLVGGGGEVTPSSPTEQVQVQEGEPEQGAEEKTPAEEVTEPRREEPDEEPEELAAPVVEETVRVGLQLMELRRKFDQYPTVVGQSFKKPAIEPPPVEHPIFFDFSLQLDQDGKVLEIEPIGTPPDQAYAAALQASLYRTQFVPGQRKGEAVKGRFRARVRVEPLSESRSVTSP